MSRIDGYTNLFCPVCRSQNHQPMTGSSGPDLRCCDQCQFVFAHHLPSLDELRNQMSASSSSPGCVAPNSHRRMTTRLKYWAFSKIIQRLCRKESVIQTLELGCDKGVFLETVQDNRHFQSTGLDWREKVVEDALTHGHDAHLTDLNSLNYPDNTFDFVFSLRPVGAMHNPEQLMLETLRILKPGGYLFSVMPGKGSLNTKLSARFASPNTHQFWAFGKQTLSQFVKRFEFQSVYCLEYSSKREVCVLARKPQNVDINLIPTWVGLANNQQKHHPSREAA